MYDSILVPTDGSDAAVAAAEGALELAQDLDATLHVIHVLELQDLPRELKEETGVPDELADRGEEIVSVVADLARDAGIEAVTAVVEAREPVHEAIVDYAIEHPIDCIVMGTHGRTGLTRLALGSVTERTLRESPVPVLTVHDDGAIEPPFEDILVPTDGSDGARAAADHAVDLAAEMDAALHVVHAVDVTSLSYENGSPAVLEALQESGQRAVDEIVDTADTDDLRSVQGSILSGTPARSIIEYANDRGVDVIVMGTHGRTGLDRLLLGSVTEKVVRLADVPVIGVKAPDVVDELLSE